MGKLDLIYSLETRQERLLAAVKYLKLEFPTVELMKATGYSNPLTSQMLAGNRTITPKFLTKLCDKYGF